MLAGEIALEPEYVARIRAEFGLDKPLLEQYYVYITNVLHGNFGYSWVFKRPVIDIIIDRLPATLLLMFSQLFLAAVAGVLIAIFLSSKPYSIRDSVASTVSLLAYCMPSFWLGMMLLLLFSVRLGLFPSAGMVELREVYTGFERVVDVARHLFLPGITLGLGNLAVIFRLMRSSMLEQVSMDYILTAKAKGLGETEVLVRHVAKNALIPVVTMVGFQFSHALAGAVVTETVFSWPGVGRLMFDAIYARDNPMLMGIFTIVSISVVLANLMTDITYSALDPRIRYR
jgi:peptide/nickel transport system permease protein